MHKTGTWLLTLLVASPLLVQAGCTWMSGCGAPQEGAPGLAATPAEVVVNSNLPGAYKAAEGATLPLRGLRLHAGRAPLLQQGHQRRAHDLPERRAPHRPIMQARIYHVSA